MNDLSRTRVMWALNAKFTVVARAVVLDDADRALLLRGTVDDAWELPRVYLQRRDEPDQAIAGLIRGRTGIVADPLWPIALEASVPPHLEVLYAGRAVAGQAADAFLPATWRWCAPDSVPPPSAAAVQAAIATLQTSTSPAHSAPSGAPHLAAG